VVADYTAAIVKDLRKPDEPTAAGDDDFAVSAPAVRSAPSSLSAA
jgi:hypothetical protein